MINFQTDNLVVPFTTETLDNVLRNLCNYFEMRDVILNSNTTYKRLKVDFTDKMSQVSAESTGLGFAVKNKIKVLEKKVAN